MECTLTVQSRRSGGLRTRPSEHEHKHKRCDRYTLYGLTQDSEYDDQVEAWNTEAEAVGKLVSSKGQPALYCLMAGKAVGHSVVRESC